MLSSRILPGRIGRAPVRGHPLCPDAAWFFGDGGNAATGGLVTTDVIRGYPAQAAIQNATLAGGAGRFGPVLAFAGTPSNLEQIALAPASLIPTDQVTIVIASRKTDATLRASLGFNVDTATDDTKRCQAHMPYSDGTVYWDYGGSSEGAGRLSVAGLTFGDDIWIFTAGPRGHEIWQNGISRAKNTDTTGRIASTLTFYLGAQGSGTSPTNDVAAYAFLFVYRRQLTPTQCVAISLRPDQWLALGARPDVTRKPSGGGGTPFTKAVADTVGLTESLIRQGTRPLAETVALTETITRQTNRALAESVALSESLHPQTRRLLAETVSLTETTARQIAKAQAEGVTLTENLQTVKAVLKSLGDTVGLTESLQRMVAKAQVDSVGLTESVRRLEARVLEETVGLTEAESRQVRRMIAESLSLAESLVTSVVKLHQEGETVGLTETLRRQAGRTLQEPIALTEAETRQIGRALQETLGLTETRIVQLAKRVAEQVALAEVLGTLFLSGVPATFHIVRVSGETFGGPAMATEEFGGPRVGAETFSVSR